MIRSRDRRASRRGACACKHPSVTRESLARLPFARRKTPREDGPGAGDTARAMARSRARSAWVVDRDVSGLRWRTRALGVALALTAMARASSGASVTPNVTSQVRDRFGTNPGGRAGHAGCATADGRAIAVGGRSTTGDRMYLADVWELDLRRVNSSTTERRMVWTMLHDGVSPGMVPSGRSGSAAVVVSGDVYVFGGYSSALRGDLDELWVFNRTSGSWSELSPVDGYKPPGRSGASVSAPEGEAGGALVVYGGNGRNDVWEYDVDANRWTMIKENTASSMSGVGGARMGATVILAISVASLA